MFSCSSLKLVPHDFHKHNDKRISFNSWPRQALWLDVLGLCMLPIFKARED